MPAVTVDNILALPRVETPDPSTTTARPVISVTTAPTGYEGEGFPVRRAFAGVEIGALDPFMAAALAQRATGEKVNVEDVD